MKLSVESLINPGTFTFYDRTSSTADKDVPLMPLLPASVTTSSSSTDAPVKIPCPDPIELEPPAKGVLTIQEYLSHVILSLDVSTQTLLLFFFQRARKTSWRTFSNKRDCHFEMQQRRSFVLWCLTPQFCWRRGIVNSHFYYDVPLLTIVYKI